MNDILKGSVEEQLAYLFPLSDKHTKAFTKCIILCVFPSKVLNILQFSFSDIVGLSMKTVMFCC